VVEAAGGVVWRRETGGITAVLLVHRPQYDDWSLPKGKLDPGEAHEEAAIREVHEETGVRCRLVEELPSTRYTDRHGREKRVRYWAMEPLDDDGFVPNDEVDALRWLAVADARSLLTYERDRDVLDAFAGGVSAG
jgi:8-oxo-dGTP diphosphatase